MLGHSLHTEDERRFAILGRDPSKHWTKGEDGKSYLYPCRADCKAMDHRHSGSTIFIYAVCSCGWKALVGDHINPGNARAEARLQHLQHQIDVLGGGRNYVKEDGDVLQLALTRRQIRFLLVALEHIGFKDQESTDLRQLLRWRYESED